MFKDFRLGAFEDSLIALSLTCTEKQLSGLGPVRSLRDRQQFWDPDGGAERAGISSVTWQIFGVLWPAGFALAQEMKRFLFAGSMRRGDAL